jgi:hypothetical protein
MACRATPCAPISCPAAPAPALPARWLPASCRLRSAPTRPARAACRPACRTSSGSSRASAWCRRRRRAGLPHARLRFGVCLTVDDATAVLEVIAGPDAADPFSRTCTVRPAGRGRRSQNRGSASRRSRLRRRSGGSASFALAVERAQALGAIIVPLDMTPFYETARLLYDGPWVAERFLAIRELLTSDPEAILPVIRQVIAGKPLPDAADTFAAQYRLAELALAAKAALNGIDAMMVPTAPRPVTLAEMAADPIGQNSLLGRYTNFVNLLDMCALAVPVSLSEDGTAAGVTFIAPSGRDAALASFGRAFHHASGLTLGATAAPMPPLADLPLAAARHDRDRGRRRASLGHAAQWRADRAGRELPASDHDHGRLPPLRLAGRPAGAAGPDSRRAGRSRDRARSLGAACRRLWPLRRRHSFAAGHRHAGARRRHAGQGLPVRADRDRRRAPT